MAYSCRLRVLVISALAAMAIALGACATPQPAPPVTPFTLPATFSTPQSGAHAPGERWWRDFGDPELDQIVDVALERNPAIAQAVARTSIAEAQVRLTRAGQLPQAGVRAAAARQRQNVTGFPILSPEGGGDSGVIRTTRYDVALEVSWELDLWGRLSALSASARSDYLARTENLRAVRQAVAARVVQMYLAIVHAHAQVELSARTVNTLAEMARQIDNRVSSGIAPPADGRLANANLESARAGLAQRREALARSLRQLEALMGDYPSGRLETALILPGVPDAPSAGVPADLLARRPDVLAGELTLLSAGYRLTAAERSFLPAISISGNAAYGGTSLADLFSGSNLLWSIAGIIVQPIFLGGRLVAQVDMAKGQADEALHSYVETALNALTEVETVLAVDQLLKDRELALDASASAAEEATRISYNRYMQDIDPFLNVLTSQQRALDGRSAQIAARYARLENRVALYLALGGGFEGATLSSASTGASAAAPSPSSNSRESQR